MELNFTHRKLKQWLSIVAGAFIMGALSVGTYLLLSDSGGPDCAISVTGQVTNMLIVSAVGFGVMWLLFTAFTDIPGVRHPFVPERDELERKVEQYDNSPNSLSVPAAIMSKGMMEAGSRRILAACILLSAMLLTGHKVMF